jgi:hypothetical protein
MKEIDLGRRKHGKKRLFHRKEEREYHKYAYYLNE